VRGDSIRDLYAKTLALLGLGVLAGAGALVDYWPVGITFPEAGAALEAPTVVVAIPPAALQVPVLRAHPGQLVTGGLPIAPAFEGRAVLPLPVTDTLPVAVGQQVSLAMPNAFPPAAQPALTTDPSNVVPAADYQSVALMIDDGAFGIESSLAPVDDEPDGLITGAFKKAGSSIMKTGMKTGASIFDAARVIGGAVRKALPN